MNFGTRSSGRYLFRCLSLLITRDHGFQFPNPALRAGRHDIIFFPICFVFHHFSRSTNLRILHMHPLESIPERRIWSTHFVGTIPVQGSTIVSRIMRSALRWTSTCFRNGISPTIWEDGAFGLARNVILDLVFICHLSDEEMVANLGGGSGGGRAFG